MKSTTGCHKTVQGKKKRDQVYMCMDKLLYVTHTDTPSVFHVEEDHFKQLAINNSLEDLETWLTEVHKALIFKKKG